MVVQTPVAYPCNAEQQTAQGVAVSSGGSSAAPASACQEYPKLSTDITLPAVGGVGQFRAPCASSWAIPGLTLWFPPFGNVKVTGVSGELVTYQNLTIPAGTTLGAGSPVVTAGPAVEDTGDYETVTQLDAVLGLVDGVMKQISGSAGDVLRFCSGKWVKHAMQLSFKPVNESKVYMGAGSSWTHTGHMAAAETFNLPSKPAAFCSGQVWLVAELGCNADATARANLSVDGVLMDLNNDTNNPKTRVVLLNVTSKTSLDLRVYRDSGSAQVYGWFNVLGYLA